MAALILALLLPASLAYGVAPVAYEGVIMENAVEPGHGLSDEGRWTPSPEEAAKAEQLVKTALTDPLADARYRQILRQFGQYKRQYYGITEKGQKLLFVNYFMREGKAADFATAPVEVADGGAAFFRAKVSLVAGMVKDIDINNGAPQRAETHSVEGVIMPIGVKPGYHEYEGYFMPTPQQTSAAESIVREALGGQLADGKMAAVSAKLSNYRRQYYGVTDKGAQKIFINYFIPEASQLKDDRWRKEAVVALDGGDAYFQALVDLASGHCDISVNGEA